jgi:hypothetical protein
VIWDGIYAFEAADDQLTLLPMAARRALDLAGLHLSLAEWQRSSLALRGQLIALGAAAVVNATQVCACLRESGAALRVQPALTDPPRDLPPPELEQLPDFEPACWAQLRPLDRYVLARLAARGKLERLAVAHAEILSTHDRGQGSS